METYCATVDRLGRAATADGVGIWGLARNCRADLPVLLLRRCDHVAGDATNGHVLVIGNAMSGGSYNYLFTKDSSDLVAGYTTDDDLRRRR